MTTRPPPVLQLRHVRVTLEGADVLRDASVDVDAGQVVLLLGRSGAGKSVLIKAALGFVPRAGGQVLLDGKDVDVEPLRHAVTLVHQAPALLPELDVLHNVAQPLRWREGMGATQAVARARAALELVGAAALEHADTAALSAGEQKLVALARAVAAQSRVLLLDEPTTGLDVGSARRVGLACGRIAARGTALLVVTHDVALFVDVAHHVALLHHGTVAEQAAMPAALTAPSAALKQFLEGEQQGPLA